MGIGKKKKTNCNAGICQALQTGQVEGGREGEHLLQELCWSFWTRTAKGGTGRGSELRIWVSAAPALPWAVPALCMGNRRLWHQPNPSLDGNLAALCPHIWGQTKAQALKSSKPLCCGAELPKRGWAPFAELSQGNPKRLKGHRFRASPSPDSSCPWHSSSWPAGCSLGTHSGPPLATKIRAARSWMPLWSGDQKQGHPSSSPSPN